MKPTMDETLRARIQQTLDSHGIVLFMKGTRGAPQCGFSARVVQMLDDLVDDYLTVDVLADGSLREGIKEYSSWPTIPQLFVRGKLVGGCDIVTDAHADGSLHSMLGVEQRAVPAPKLVVSPAAATALREVTAGTGEVVRLEFDASYEPALMVGPRQPRDVQAEVEDPELVIMLDATSARRAAGTSIDFIATPQGNAFKIENPNAPPRVKEIDPETLRDKLKAGEIPILLDVRTPAEREIAAIEGSRLLDRDVLEELDGVERDTPIALYCHHGMRSRSAAEHLLSVGFKTVYNLAGGIDVWSQRIDPSVPRY